VAFEQEKMRGNHQATGSSPGSSSKHKATFDVEDEDDIVVSYTVGRLLT